MEPFLMRREIEHALQTDELMDLTTTGRRSGRPHRIEARFMYRNGRVYLSGFPGKRDWMANIRSNPEVVIHLKQSVQADLAAKARIVTEGKERRPLLVQYMEFWTPIIWWERLLRFLVIHSARLWVRLRLPMWGPMWPLGRIMRGMPLVEFEIAEEKRVS